MLFCHSNRMNVRSRITAPVTRPAYNDLVQEDIHSNVLAEMAVKKSGRK